MLAILSRSLTLILVIVSGYFFKKIGIFSKERDFPTLSNLILYVTLPSVIITNLNGLRFSPTLLVLSIFGFLCNWIYIIIANFAGKNTGESSFLVLNINGYNIGNFALPFITFFLGGGTTTLAISLFDVGSTMMVLGGNYILARQINNNSNTFNMRELINTFLKTPTILVYLIMIFLSLTNLNLPNLIVDLAEIAGVSNTFLAMFLIGIALEFNFKKENIRKISKYMLLRYIPAFILASFVMFLPIMDIEIKYAISILLFAPVASSATIFTNLLDGNTQLSAQINSMSIILSIIMMSSVMFYISLIQ